MLILTIEDMCKRQNLSRQTVYNEINAGRLRSYKVGKSRRITEAAETEWIEQLEATSALPKDINKKPHLTIVGPNTDGVIISLGLP